MPNRFRTSIRLIPCLLCPFLWLTATLQVQAQNQAQSLDSPAETLMLEAAAALGGLERLNALRQLRYSGYGHQAYQDGGSEITTEPEAPEKLTRLTAYERVTDLDNDRTRLRARLSQGFVFAARSFMQGLPVHRVLDADIAYDVSPDGSPRRAGEDTALERRMEMLAHPVVAVRTALAGDSRMSNRRSVEDKLLVDIEPAFGRPYTLAIDASTKHPRWVRWTAPHENLGEVTLRTEFSAYLPVQGLQLPMSFRTVSDFRDTVILRLHVDRYVLDGDIEDLTAPPTVRESETPMQEHRVEAETVAPGIWLLTGSGGANSILLEFADHLSLFEVPTSRAWTRTLIDTARELVPDKPLTEAIITHHHFDHTGGLRTAVAEGLTIITQAGNAQWFRDLVARPVEHFPDQLSRNPRPIEIRTVDDHLRISDEALTVDLYHVVDNGHMTDALMGHVPGEQLLLQGDLFDVNWEIYFWEDTYDSNIAHRALEVERDVPIHGRVLPVETVRDRIAEQIASTRELCAEVAEANLSLPGCPLDRHR